MSLIKTYCQFDRTRTPLAAERVNAFSGPPLGKALRENCISNPGSKSITHIENPLRVSAESDRFSDNVVYISQTLRRCLAPERERKSNWEQQSCMEINVGFQQNITAVATVDLPRNIGTHLLAFSFNQISAANARSDFEVLLVATVVQMSSPSDLVWVILFTQQRLFSFVVYGSKLSFIWKFQPIILFIFAPP